MPRERLETRIRQEQIARAALNIVAKEGLHGLNIAAVAREVGIVPSAIYRHFEGRAGVVDAALRLVGRRLHDNVGAARKRTPNPMEGLRLLLERHLRLLVENPGIPRRVFSEEVSSDPRRRRALYASIRRYLSQVAVPVREAQQGGQIRADLDADTVSRMFLGLIQPAAILWQISDREFDLMDHGMQAWEIFSLALVERGGRAEKTA